MYERLARAIQNPEPVFPYRFDEEAGDPIIFIEKFCKQSQGIIGAPLVFEDLASDSNTLDGLNSHAVIITVKQCKTLASDVTAWFCQIRDEWKIDA